MSDRKPPAEIVSSAAYRALLDEVRGKAGAARDRAARSINSELVLLYWDIGRAILDRQSEHRWGDDVVGLLAADLRAGTPSRGLSRRNLFYMRQFAGLFPSREFVQTLSAQIGWSHHQTLLNSFAGDPDTYAWYAARAIEGHWSVRHLRGQIDLKLHLRAGAAITSFQTALPAPDASDAIAVLKDPYVLDFVDLQESFSERQLEQALIDDVQSFLRELGVGFAFYGRQQPLLIGGREFFLDLLFYHHKLRRFVVIDLKLGEFEPEYAGKMGLYLNAVDEQLRHPEDRESIGLILCTSLNETVAKFALHRNAAPIAVAGWQTSTDVEITDELPEALKTELAGMPQVRDQLTTRVTRTARQAAAALPPAPLQPNADDEPGS